MLEIKVLLLSFAIVASVVPAQGQTPVCMPERFQATILDIYKTASVVVAWDVPKNRTVSVIDGVRHVFDLYKKESYEIKSPGQCVKTASTEGNPLPFLCLPDFAKLVDDKMTWGLGRDSLQVQLWNLELPNNATLRVVLTSQQPHVPVLLASSARPPVTTTNTTFLPDGTVIQTSETVATVGSTMLFFDPTIDINVQLFDVPLACLN